MPPNRRSCIASRRLQSAAYLGASTSYLPIVAFQRNWIVDGVGALGQGSHPSTSSVRLCVRLKGTGVAVYWGGGVGVEIGGGVGLGVGAGLGAAGATVEDVTGDGPLQAA